MHIKYAKNFDEALGTYYSSDGEICLNPRVSELDIIKNSACSSSTTVTTSMSNDDNNPKEHLKVYAMLEPGDILIFDTKLFHHGTSNMSLLTRALMCLSFQKKDVFGNSETVNGFTYHCDRSVSNKNITLHDFVV